jgi:hypothetical protein
MGGEPAITRRGGSREVDATSCRLGLALKGFVSGGNAIYTFVRYIPVVTNSSQPYAGSATRCPQDAAQPRQGETVGNTHKRMQPLEVIQLIDCVGCFWFSESDRDTAGLKFENAGDRWDRWGRGLYTEQRGGREYKEIDRRIANGAINY